MATRQLSLFDDRTKPVPPCDPSVAPEDHGRLSRHAAAVLARLRKGPCTNAEFVREPETYGMNITGRISDCREAGYTIGSKRETGGLWTYTLEFEP